VAVKLPKIKFEPGNLVGNPLFLIVVAVLGFAVLGKYLGIFVLPESITLLCVLIIMFFGIIEVVTQIVHNIPGVGWLMDNAEDVEDYLSDLIVSRKE